MNRYRIVTNGRTFMVQKRFWKFWITDGMGYMTTREEAQRQIDANLNGEGPWWPVGQNGNGYPPLPRPLPPPPDIPTPPSGS